MNEVELSRATRLLPLAVIAAAICLFASELMTMFEFTPPGGEALDLQSASERHGNAMFVIAVFAIGALALAVFTASQPAAIAVGAMGVIALLFFLLGDLPDAGQVGTLDDERNSFFDAEAVPQEGFWLLLVSSLALAVTGIALATLTPEQLATLRPGRRKADSPRSARAAAAKPTPARKAATPESPAAQNAAESPTSDGKRPLGRSRSRSRSRPRG